MMRYSTFVFHTLCVLIATAAVSTGSRQTAAAKPPVASGEGDNTLVVFTSDNGGVPAHGGSNTPLRGNKFQTYEGGVRVLAALRWPVRFPEPKVNNDTLAYIDVWPTLATIAGIEDISSEIDGEDMLPALTSDVPRWDRVLYLRGGSIIAGEWKLYVDARNCDDPLKCGALYHLKNDPYETTDLAKKMPEKVRELNALATDYKSLHGPAFLSKLKTEAWPPQNWELSDEPRN